MEKTELSTTLQVINPIIFARFQFYLIDRYVDDMFTASSKIQRRFKWNHETGALQWSLNLESEQLENREDDARTLEEIAKVATHIFKCLNLTWDSLSRNKSGMMPVLDV